MLNGGDGEGRGRKGEWMNGRGGEADDMLGKTETVYKKPLALFSQKPMTGFYRDGYCRTGADDGGNHAVAGSFFSFLFVYFDLHVLWFRGR